MPKLEESIGGFIPIGLSIMHGRPGSGKTALGNQLAAQAGCPALVVSLEMRFLELMHRNASRVTGEWIDKFRKHELEPSVWLDKMRKTVATLPQLRIVDATSRAVSMDSVRDMALATRGDSKHLLIVIDSLHAWARRYRGNATEYDFLGVLITSLAAMAQDLNASVLAIAEQNRASRGSTGQDAATANGGIEYTGELVIALNRDSDAPPDADGERAVNATLAKNRHGEENTRVQLKFHGRTMAFREAEVQTTGSASAGNGKSKSRS
jgi:replicative DNA helicase